MQPAVVASGPNVVRAAPYPRVIGVLEWIGAHLLAPFVNLYRVFATKPRPELKLHEIKATGGDGDNVHFAIEIQNVGTKPTRCVVMARVGGTPVQVLNSPVDLLPNTLPTRVEIRVLRSATS